jgi:hypothetical protein
MGDPQPAIVPIPPKMEVGYNYPWPFGRYGTTIGPRDLENEPPLGNNSDVAVFRDVKTHPPEGSLAKNLTFLRDELNIRKVRMFLLGNAWNYGRKPFLPKGVFIVPDFHPLFLKHFREMLEVFAAKEMQILPSLIDFAAFYELDRFNGTRFVGSGSGRTEIARNGRKKFFDTVLKPLLGISADPDLRKTIFAWEVVNEPRWPLTNISLINILPQVPKRPHTETTGNDLDVQEMSTFIREALNIIETGFPSTVGHRFLGDLVSSGSFFSAGTMPGGTKPQFHYYAMKVPDKAKIQLPGDPDTIPDFASLAGDPRTKDAFIGEFHSDMNRPWPECGGRDNTLRTTAFERLKVLAQKGYPLVFVWPDGGPPGADNTDALKLMPDTIESIKQFTRGRFPNGVP